MLSWMQAIIFLMKVNPKQYIPFWEIKIPPSLDSQGYEYVSWMLGKGFIIGKSISLKQRGNPLPI
jgi:hypothetical protein